MNKSSSLFRFISVAFLILIIWFTQPLQAGNPMDKPVSQMVNALLEKTSLKGRKIAVGEFVDSEKRMR